MQKTYIFFFFILWGTFTFGQTDSLHVKNDTITSTKDSLFIKKIDSILQHKTEAPKKDTVRHWSISGQNALTLNQASFSNWAAGGSNNIGWIAAVSYNFTYEDEKNLWENIIILGYGQSKTQGLSIRKTQDVINFSTNYGRKFSKHWFLSAGAGIISQFSAGYDYDNKNPIKSDVYHTEGKRISLFMAPGYLNLGIGVTYKPSPNFSFNLYPSNARFTFVLEPSLQYAGNFGLSNDGDFMLFQLGMLANIYYKQKIMENTYFTNNFSAFSNYLENPERMVINYLGTLDFKVNKVISASVVANVIYDHNQIRKTQLRQTLGIGFTFNVSNGVKRSEHKHNRAWKL